MWERKKGGGGKKSYQQKLPLKPPQNYEHIVSLLGTLWGIDRTQPKSLIQADFVYLKLN